MLDLKLIRFFLIVLFFSKIGLAISQPIDELIKKILKTDESINSSKIFVDKANNDLSSTTSLYTPKLDITIPVGREILINNDSSNTDLNYYEFSAKITQNIYDFGNTASKYDKAKNQVELANISSKNTKSNKIFEALAAYLGYIKAYEVLEFSKQSEARIREVTNLENEKVARGGGLASNVLQSKARLAGAKATRVRFEGDLSVATNRFYNIFRELPNNFSTFNRPNLPTNLLPKSEKEAIELAKKNNISLNLSKLNLKNSETAIRGAKSKFFPSIKAIAEYKNKRNMSGLDGTEIDHVYKLEMKYPISIGGPYGLFYKESSDYKSSLNQYMMSKYGHDQLERNLEETIRNAWQTKKIAKQNYEYLSNQANISGEFFDLAMREVKLGNRQLIDILSSETAYINAKSSAESAKTQYELAVYQLILSIGILDEKIFLNASNGIEKKSKIIKKQLKNSELKKIKKKLTKTETKKSKLVNYKKENNEDKNILIKDLDVNDFEKTKKLEENNNKKTNKKAKNIIVKKLDAEINEKPNEFDMKKIKLDTEISDEATSLNNIISSVDNEKSSIKKTISYKLQFGAFSKKNNANIFLKELKEVELNIVNFSVETDLATNLYKIKSTESYTEQKAKNLCEQFKSYLYNCILSKI